VDTKTFKKCVVEAVTRYYHKRGIAVTQDVLVTHLLEEIGEFLDAYAKSKVKPAEYHNEKFDDALVDMTAILFALAHLRGNDLSEEVINTIVQEPEKFEE
jgi:NTP pyrophosphatase (non-canonical NTP hydrolase)